MINIKKVFIGHLFVFIFVFGYSVTNAKTYYVDSRKGSDGNPGTAIDSAWKSIAKVNSQKFFPGDSILFKCGSEWREELIIYSSGDSLNYITFGSYGTGKRPKILGSVMLKKFVPLNSTVWKVKADTTGNWLWFVSADTIHWGNKKNGIDELNSDGDFFIDGRYVYVYGIENPARKFLSVELSVRDFGIVSGWYGKGAGKIKIENFELLFTKNAGIRIVGGEDWIIENCVSHHNGATDESDGQGIQYEGENGLFTKNILYENGQHGLYLSAFGNAPVSNNIIEHNTVFDNYHTGIDIMNNGDSLHTLKNTVVRFNKVYDNINFNGKEVGIQFYAFNGGKIENVEVYYNILFNTKGIGISVQDNTDSVYIFNNTVYQPLSTCFTLDNDSGYVEMYNNIGLGDNYYAIIFIHNPVNKKVDYNCWFRRSGNLAWVAGEYFGDWNVYVLKTGFDKHGINADPLLTRELKLTENSPCVNKGKYVGLQKDYGNKKLDDEKIDIGAYECF